MKKNRLISFLFVPSMLVGLTGCNSNVSYGPVEENKGTTATYNVSYYDNSQYSDYHADGASSIANQWEEYGLSSPFIMRFNGEYYLYASTSENSNDSGVRGWKSSDLVNWETMTGEGLPTGYVVGKDKGATFKARAPEVYYYNGYFYMYESNNGGVGHFILRSKKPNGPFTSLNRSSLDSKRDGTIFFGANDNPFFITGGKGQISISTMQSMESILDTEIKINGTDRYSDLNTDSPSLFFHAGKYYLLYSSGYDTLNSYHINYSVSDGWDDETPSGLANSFRYGATDKLMVNTDKSEGAVGLGHPSTVLGPDLDSIYMAYDSIDDAEKNIHSYNLDRLFASGDLLTAKHNLNNSIVPDKAVFSSNDETGLIHNNEYYFADGTTKDSYSVEYNFSKGQNSEFVFSYLDDNNYSYIAFDATSSISVHQKKDGEDKLIKSAEFYNLYSNDDLHTIRISYREDKLDVFFDNFLKIKADNHFVKGKVGYKKGGDLKIYHTSYSNVGGGLSDNKAIKQAGLDIPTALHMVNNQVEDVESYKYDKLHTGVIDFASVSYVSLKHNDFARYLIDFKKSATYGVEFLINKNSNGKSVIVEVDDKENITLGLPYNYSGGEYIKVVAGEININKGVHQFKIQGLNDSFDCVSFKLIEKAEKDLYINASLKDEANVRGFKFGSDSSWNFTNGAMSSLANRRNIALTENKNITDFDLSVDLALTGDDSIFRESDESGIAFRCTEYGDYSIYAEGYTDINMTTGKKYDLRGYYMAFTPRKVILYRMDLTERSSVVISNIRFSFGSKKTKTITLKARGSRFDLFVNGTLVSTYYDELCYSSGSVGLYATGSESSYSNFKLLTK